MGTNYETYTSDFMLMCNGERNVRLCWKKTEMSLILYIFIEKISMLFNLFLHNYENERKVSTFLFFIFFLAKKII